MVSRFRVRPGAAAGAVGVALVVSGVAEVGGEVSVVAAADGQVALVAQAGEAVRSAVAGRLRGQDSLSVLTPDWQTFGG